MQNNIPANASEVDKLQLLNEYARNRRKDDTVAVNWTESRIKLKNNVYLLHSIYI